MQESEENAKNFPRIMRYSIFRVNDSLRINDQPTTFTPLLPNYSNYTNYPTYLPNYNNNMRSKLQGLPKEDDYFPFEGSIMSPIFPEELSELYKFSYLFQLKLKFVIFKLISKFNNLTFVQ